MPGSEASTFRSTFDLIGGQCCFLVCSNWQDPGSHGLVHIADTVALELKSLLPWIYNLSRTVQIGHSVGSTRLRETGLNSSGLWDCQNYERSTWASCHAGGSIGSGTVSEGIVPSSATKSFQILVPKNMFTAEDSDFLLRPKTQKILLPCDFFLFGVFGIKSRRHHNNLGILCLAL